MTHPYKAHSLRDEGSDQVAKASAAAKAQEHILYGARKQRKETDDQLQVGRAGSSGTSSVHVSRALKGRAALPGAAS